MTARTVTVLAPGPLSTIQDDGRPGLGHLGIGRSGAADLASLQRANLLVGNEPGAAGIEMTFGGIRLVFQNDAVVALGGAPCGVSTAGHPVPFGAAVRIAAGTELRCRTPKVGVRTYLAVDGGIDVPAVLGSRSTDTLSGLGPAPLAVGTTFPLGSPSTDPAPAPPADAGFTVEHVLTLLPGPRADWFTIDATRLLLTSRWTVTPQADRVGVRLAGPPLIRRGQQELPSEAMVPGALQVPPDGQPILFLADHPVTGGYPVIGVVTTADLGHAAQLRPGKTVGFRSNRREWSSH